MNTNIAITGESIISAIGLDKSAVLQSLREQRTGIGKMAYLHSTHKELPVGEVKLTNDEIKRSLEIDKDRTVSRAALLGIKAVKQALVDAKLECRHADNHALRIVLVSGTTVGGMDITENYFRLSDDWEMPADCLKYHDCGSSTQQIVDYFGIFNEFTTISTACSSAANAIILGANLIKNGQADIVVAGGTEALSRFHLNGFNSLMILDKELCKPFDADRAGLNLGEGAAYVVLEAEEIAKLRGVVPHAYLRGYGNACDAFHQTASSENGEGAYLAMTEALSMAHLEPNEIQYINAHGTGTVNNDASESAALLRVFGKDLPYVSSTKGFTGHTTSASGCIEAVICLLSMRNHFVPANLGWQHQMVNGITPTLGVKDCELHNILCNSFGFGGNDSSLIISSTPVDTGCPANERTCLEKDIRIASEIEINSEEQLAEIRNYVTPLEARRMGKIMKSSLLSSLKALKMAGIEVPDAIITGTALGCWENSELMLKQLIEEGETPVRPTYFMQSTHNTIGSNIAIHTKCHGYNVTYTQGEHSLEWAIRDAKMLLKSGKYKSVLVGCHDETTPLYRSLMERSGVKGLNVIHSVAMVLICGN